VGVGVGVGVGYGTTINDLVITRKSIKI
jgi:hypothetical protein